MIENETRGRPPVYAPNNARKISATLLNRHIRYLDTLKARISGHAGKSVSRSELLQLLVEALIASNPNLSRVESLEELWEVMLHRVLPRK